MGKTLIPSVGARVRALLEDFDALATMQHVVLLPRRVPADPVVEDVFAGLVRSGMRLSSLDYARRKYPLGQELALGLPRDPVVSAYVNGYFAAKAYVERMRAKLVIAGRPEASTGVFRASVVLERLPTSFFSAHLLYQLGQRHEGHAVSRLILEQMAWAFAVCRLDQLSDIEAKQSTRAIAALKSAVPTVGRLYGFLSEETHINTALHPDMLVEVDRETKVRYASPRFLDYAFVLLSLADIFGIVWEYSQSDYIDQVETIRLEAGTFSVLENRPFAARMDECLVAVRDAQGQRAPS